MTFKAELLHEGQNFLLEFIQLLGFLLILKVGEFLVGLLFHSAFVFGRFPKEWLFDAGDIGLVACFSLRACLRLLGLRA
ncbi:hypothetical protein [Tunturiibacter gelidoferens]|uniref:Uncharacterized protein n=1 Tax=Tunturiibacter lichenicola TaxID=2051959 RepID=A0A7Y9NKS2_9BACT|nr:hypothetical protein [Edaphobacter lichenicola]NYF51201.1 hypothetical protein [Edaphobacter lichenicola]